MPTLSISSKGIQTMCHNSQKKDRITVESSIISKIYLNNK